MSQYASNLETSGGGSSSNASVGPVNTTAPTSATEVGFVNGSGNLTAVSPTNPLPVTIESEVGTLNVNVAQYGGAATSLGQKTSAASQPVVIASDQTTLSVSASTLPLPTGAATSALQSNVQSAPGTPQTVALTIQGNASGVAIPVSAASLPLPTGAATSSNQTTIGSQTTKINDGTNTATIKPASTAALTTDTALVVAISPNNTIPVSGTVAATQSGTWNLNNISGTVSLPTGASTSALQTTGNTTLSTIATNTTGASTSALQTTGNTSLATIATNTTTPTTPISGQKTSSGTAVALSASQPLVVGVIVQALSTNTGLVYIGASGVTTSTGFQLQPGQATSAAVNNLASLFVIAVSSGDGVCFIGS